LTLYF